MPTNTDKEADITNPRPQLPNLAGIQSRRAELLAMLTPSQREKYPPASALYPDPSAPRDTRPLPPRPPTEPILDERALHGVAGQMARTLAPQTEAHTAALLLQFLAAFGNLVGPGPHCMVGGTRHGLNLFAVLVGDSSKARKGTSWSQIARLFAAVDPGWLSTRVTSARLTAAGLVYALRDQQPPTDRRLLVLSEEFASVLHSLKRAKGQLSPLIRSAWDHGHLPTLDIYRQVPATGTHVSLIAHITQRELAQSLHPTEAHNGFANRCLWTWVKRSNCFPEGGSIDPNEFSDLIWQLRRAVEWTTADPEILFQRDTAARELWQERYPALSQARPGLRGAATSRAEAQVLRLSAIYAALDRTSAIGLPHLDAALAVWDYCEASAGLLFGLSTGDPIADRIREALEASGRGLSKHQIRRLFHGHIATDRIDSALRQLIELSAIRGYSEPGRGRPATLWSSVAEPQQEEPEAESMEQESENPEEEGIDHASEEVSGDF